MQGVEQCVAGWRLAAEAAAQFLKQPAEGAFAVGQADRDEAAVERRREIEQVAVVGENPVAAPQFAYEGMGVFQPDCALRRLADMGDDVPGADRVAAYQFGDRRGARRLRAEQEPGALALEEGDAPAVGMDVGGAAAGLEAAE